MTYINSNLTNREAYALYGKLDDARMQELLDLKEQNEALEQERDEAQCNYENMLQLAAKVAEELRSINLNHLVSTAQTIEKVIDDLENY